MKSSFVVSAALVVTSWMSLVAEGSILIDANKTPVVKDHSPENGGRRAGRSTKRYSGLQSPQTSSTSYGEKSLLGSVQSQKIFSNK